MKKQKYIILFILSLLFISCEVDEDAKVIVTDKKTGFEQGGIIYADITLKNTGEQPAYFVVINVSAIINNQEAEYREKAYGDIFPDEEKTERVKFTTLGGVFPDDIKIEIVFQNYITNLKVQ
jgi:hypothetical protein